MSDNRQLSIRGNPCHLLTGGHILVPSNVLVLTTNLFNTIILEALLSNQPLVKHPTLAYFKSQEEIFTKYSIYLTGLHVGSFYSITA